MRSKTLERAVAEASAAFPKYLLVHEAAIAAWHLDPCCELEAVDIVVPRSEFDKAGGDPTAGAFVESERGGVLFRIWSPDTLHLPETFDRVRCESYNAWALAPELVLETITMSPDIDYLHEQRACLAQVVFCEQMDDETIMEFRKYVRGV